MAEEKYYPQDLVVDYEGQELIKGFEGFLPTAKWDYGQWSVGYAWATEPGETVSVEQAESEFLGRLEPYAQAVRDRLGVPVTQSVFNALVSAAWNLGVWGGVLDPVFHSVNNRDNQGAANKLQEYVHAGGEVLEGLVNRRKAEGELIVADIPGISFEEGGPTAWPTFEVVYGANLAGAEGEGPEGIVLHHSAFGEGITKIAVDSIFMMPQLGVLSTFHEKAALEVFHKDCLIHLGSCIAPIGNYNKVLKTKGMKTKTFVIRKLNTREHGCWMTGYNGNHNTTLLLKRNGGI